MRQSPNTHIDGECQQRLIYLRPRANIVKNKDGTEARAKMAAIRLINMSRDTGMLTVGEETREVKELKNYKWENTMKDANEEASAW